MPDGSHANEGPAYPPREFWDRRPVSIDIYNNYITNAHDNSIEMDGSMHNIRLMRNVLINSASHPMSTQPSVGGPIYWIRNIVYHAPGGSTRMTAGSPGVIFYHNTVTTETSAGSSANAHWRNNLMLGQSTAPAIFSVNTSTSYSSSDYNGFRPNPGRRGVVPVECRPAAGARRAAAAGGFATLAEYAKATGQDQHSVTLDYDVFVNVPKLDRDPKTVQRLYDFKDLDFPLEARLRRDRSRRGAAEHQRRLRRQGAGSRRARSGAAAADLRPARAGWRNQSPRPSPNPVTGSTPGFIDKVWRVSESSAVAPGTLYLFLSEGTLLITSATQQACARDLEARWQRPDRWSKNPSRIKWTFSA